MHAIPLNIKLPELNAITTIYTGIEWTRCDKHKNLTSQQFINLIIEATRRDKILKTLHRKLIQYLPFTKKYNKLKKAIWRIVSKFTTENPVKCCQAKQGFKEENLIVDNWHASHQRHLLGTNGTADNFQVDYISIGTGYTTPFAAQTSITNEIYRSAPTTSYAVNNKTTVFILGVGEGNANPTFSGTTVATVTGTSSTTTSIVVGSGEGASFTAEDRIQIGLSTGNEYATIQTVNATTNTLSLYAIDALSIAPSPGDEVTITWGNIGLIAGNSSATLGTGTVLSDAKVQFAKTSTKYITIEAQVITASIAGA